MAESCPLQTPEDHGRSEIVADAAALLLDRVLAAVEEANATATAALRATGLSEVDPLSGLFIAGLHQALYCVLCGADPATFVGGKASTALAIIRNSQQIANHYWGADIEPVPRPT